MVWFALLLGDAQGKPSMCSKRLRGFTPDLFKVYSSGLLYVHKAFFFIGVSPLLDGVSSQTVAIDFEASVLRLIQSSSAGLVH